MQKANPKLQAIGVRFMPQISMPDIGIMKIHMDVGSGHYFGDLPKIPEATFTILDTDTVVFRCKPLDIEMSLALTDSVDEPMLVSALAQYAEAAARALR